jgi:hypothetical protein
MCTFRQGVCFFVSCAKKKKQNLCKYSCYFSPLLLPFFCKRHKMHVFAQKIANAYIFGTFWNLQIHILIFILFLEKYRWAPEPKRLTADWIPFSNSLDTGCGLVGRLAHRLGSHMRVDVLSDAFEVVNIIAS